MEYRNLNYTPPGPVCRDFLANDTNAAVLGIMGPIGSGKTTANQMKLLQSSQRMPKDGRGLRRSRHAIVRNSYPELRTTTMKTWHELVPREVGRWQDEGPPTHFITGPDGMQAEVMFVALDRPEDVSKVLSMDLTCAFLNEARELPKAILDAISGRVRRFPPTRDGGGFGQVQMDTNAPDSDHWYYKLAEEIRPEGYFMYRQPGGRSPGAENLANLPAGYYDDVARGKDHDWIHVYVDGEYGFVKAGRPVYPEYSDLAHCKTFELVDTLPLALGFDFGLTPAAVIGQHDRFGRWRIRHEIVSDDLDAVGIARLTRQLLESRYAGWGIESSTGDPAGESRAQTDSNTPFRIMKAEGIEATPAASNDYTLRRAAVAGALTRMAAGEPSFLLHPDCKILRKGMAGAYCMKRVMIVGEERYKDMPDKNMYSHVCEALQYLMLGAGESDRVFHVQKKPRQPREEPAPFLTTPQRDGAWML